MPDWNKDELHRIGKAHESRLAGRRADGTLHRFVVVWQVQVDNKIYARSVNGAHAQWYRGTEETGEGRIEAGGVTRDVVFTREDLLDDRIDDAYRLKYGTGSAVESITSERAISTTLRIDPA